MTSEATFSVSVAYPDPTDDGAIPVVLRPHAQVIRAQYTDESSGAASIIDTAAAGTEIEIDFGGVATEATGFYVRNETRQDLEVGINGKPLQAAITTFEGALAAQLAILNAFTGSDSAATIVAAIATANTALVAAQTTLDAAKAAPAFKMPSGAVLCYVTPASAGTPVSSLSLYATATQSGAGLVPYKVFGS